MPNTGENTGEDGKRVLPRTAQDFLNLVAGHRKDPKLTPEQETAAERRRVTAEAISRGVLGVHSRPQVR